MATITPKLQNNVAYKIWHASTGLFSTGGAYPRWTKLGKTWNTIAHLQAHLSMFKNIPSEWRVVEIQTKVGAIKPAILYKKEPF